MALGPASSTTSSAEDAAAITPTEISFVGDSLAYQIATFGDFDNHGYNGCGFTEWAYMRWPATQNEVHDACRIPYEEVVNHGGVIFVALTTHDMVLRGDSPDDLDYRWEVETYIHVDEVLRANNPSAKVVWYVNNLHPNVGYAERDAKYGAIAAAAGLIVIDDFEMMQGERYDGAHYTAAAARTVASRFAALAESLVSPSRA